MLRVAGTDPGTSSLDVLILMDGIVGDQHRFTNDALRADPALPARWLQERGPFDLIAGPSGYGLPLIQAAACTDRDLALMTLTRPIDRAGSQGLIGLSAIVRELCAAALPVVFLPGVIHLPTVPRQRKLNRIDLGTPDKLCVAALALKNYGNDLSACVVELGTAFSACLVLSGGHVVDGAGGSSGPFGWRSGGAWDGEAAYILSPLSKRDLFVGGVSFVADPAEGRLRFRESLLQTVAGLQAVTPFSHVILSGRLLETEPALAGEVATDLGRLGSVTRLAALPGAWVKQAAQGAAIIAAGLVGGSHSLLVETLAISQASGTILDWLCYPRSEEVRSAFG